MEGGVLHSSAPRGGDTDHEILKLALLGCREPLPCMITDGRKIAEIRLGEAGGEKMGKGGREGGRGNGRGGGS